MAVTYAYSEVAHVLDQLRGAATVANGVRKAITGATDTLRDGGAPADHVLTAGQVSAAIHQWELALCLRDTDKQEAARNRLDDIADRWSALSTLPA